MDLTAKRPQRVHFSTYVGFQVNLSKAYSVNKYGIVMVCWKLTKFQDSVLIS